MKYLCINCNYVFDKAFGDKVENINIGEVIEKCPVCEEYDTFQGIEEEVNYIEEEIGKIESDHFPDIEIKDNKLIVRIGGEVHPMGEDHRIAAVLLLDEYGDIIEEKYLELNLEPIVEFENFDLDEFEIRVKCSQHGLWAKKFEL